MEVDFVPGQTIGEVVEQHEERAVLEHVWKWYFQNQPATRFTVLPALTEAFLAGAPRMSGSNPWRRPVAAFKIDGVELGPYELTIDSKTGSMTVELENEANRSSYKYPHPHVSQSGVISWSANALHGTLPKLDPMKKPQRWLEFAEHFLREGYEACDAYHRLDQWRQQGNQPTNKATNIRARTP
jgi:hypothetical protein